MSASTGSLHSVLTKRARAFIQQRDSIEKRTEQIVTKINAYSPKTFIICSSKSAMGKCEKIKKNVMNRISDYDVELYKTSIKEIYFLNKTDF